MKNILVIFYLFITVTHFAQDTIAKKWKFAFQLDNRFSKVNKNNITIFGLKAGLQYRNLTRFGIGTSFVLAPISFDYVNKKTQQAETNTMEFWYVSIFNDWILFRNNRWHCFITEQIGVGKPNFTKIINDEIVSDANVLVFLNEISVQAQFRILPWIGAGTGIGYRNNLNKGGILKSVINGPVYIVKIIVYPNAIIKKSDKS